MSSAEPPPRRRPHDTRAGADTPAGGPPKSRDDLFGPSGPFGVSGTPATPRGAGGTGFEPPEDEPDDLLDDEVDLHVQPTRASRWVAQEPTRAAPPVDDEPTRAVRSVEDEPTRAVRSVEDEPTRAFPPVPDEPTRAYRPPEDTQAYQPPADATRTYPAQPAADPAPRPEPGEYRPGQYQPRSMTGDYQQRGEQEQSTYTPGQYQPGYSSRETIGYPGDAGGADGDWYGQGSPPPSGRGRRVWLAALLTVVLLAAGAAGAYALLGRDDGTPAATSPTTAPSASATSGGEATSEPSETASESAEPSETTEPSESAALAGKPIPDEPWTDPSLDFGFLTKVTRSGDTIRLTFNRATFLTGAEATEKNGGTPPDNDYLIEDTNKKLRTFDLVANAPLEGSAQLGGTRTAEGTEITEDELVAAMRNLAGNNPGGVPVWLRHKGGGKDGPVTALAEQFVP
jgi:hypothetical protein